MLLAKLQPPQQEAALVNCFREDWGGGAGKAKRIVLPVRHLQYWIEHNVFLLLKQAPFNKRDTQLLPAAGSCINCPKRTGHNKLLFADVREDACTDPICYAAKLEAHVQKQISAKPELVKISTAYGKPQEGSTVVTRNKYVEIHADKPDSPEKAKQPEFKTCRFTTEATISEGIDKGELRKVCTEADCPIHHPKKQTTKSDSSFKAEHDKSRREEALANATGMRVLQTIAAAVPVRLMKRDQRAVAAELGRAGCIKVIDGETDRAALQGDEGDGDRTAVLVDAVHGAGGDGVDRLGDLDDSTDVLAVAKRISCQVPKWSCAGRARSYKQEGTNQQQRVCALQDSLGCRVLNRHLLQGLRLTLFRRRCST